jgi:hypothetical protein
MGGTPAVCSCCLLGTQGNGKTWLIGPAFVMGQPHTCIRTIGGHEQHKGDKNRQGAASDPGAMTRRPAAASRAV